MWEAHPGMFCRKAQAQDMEVPVLLGPQLHAADHRKPQLHASPEPLLQAIGGVMVRDGQTPDAGRPRPANQLPGRILSIGGRGMGM